MDHYVCESRSDEIPRSGQLLDQMRRRLRVITCSTSSTTFQAPSNNCGERSQGDVENNRPMGEDAWVVDVGASGGVENTIRSHASINDNKSGDTRTEEWRSAQHTLVRKHSARIGSLSNRWTASISQPVPNRNLYTYRAMNPLPTIPNARTLR